VVEIAKRFSTWGLRGLVFVFIAVILSIYVFTLLGVVTSELFSNPILYFGSAVIQAYAALVAVPFTIWVIYMQSTYGAIIVRLFLRKVIFPFTIFGIVTVVSAITIALSETPYAYHAYIAEIVTSLVFLPPLVSYIVNLMVTSPEDVIAAIESNVKHTEEFIALSLYVLRLYIMGAYPDEEAINRTLGRISYALRNVERLKLYPDVWHRFRDFLRTIVVESTFLPHRYHMSRLMTQFMKWLIVSNRSRVARAFMRYYRFVVSRYMTERIPSEVVEDLFIKPILDVVKTTKASRGLIAYALEQSLSLLRHVERMELRGDITVREVCKILELIEESVEDIEEMPELSRLKQHIVRMKKRFRCVPRKAIARKA